MKRSLMILFVVCLIVMFSSIVSAEQPVTILFSEPLSGPFKFFGDRLLLGVQFAADEINSQGGLLGRKVEVIAEDNQFKPEIARRKTEKYLMEKKGDIVIQGFSSPVAETLVDLTKQYGVLFANTAMSDSFGAERFSNNSLQLIYRSSMMARMLVTYIAEKKPFKKFYLLNPDYSYGRDTAAMFEKEIRRLIPGGEILGNDFHPTNSKDLSPFLSRVKATGAECILSCSYGVDLSVLMKQRQELGVKAIVAANPLGSPFVLREFADVAIGNIAADNWMITVNTKESLDFVDRWRKRYKNKDVGDPDNMVARTYLPLQILFQGIKKAKSLEVNKVIPILEGARLKTLNGEGYIRACDHQLQMPMPAAEIVSKSPPYYGVPTMIPAEKIEIEKSAINNPRCKQ